MTQRSGRSGSPSRRPDGSGSMIQDPLPEEPTADDPSDEELFSTMAGQWVEVECLLRVQLRSACRGSKVDIPSTVERTVYAREAELWHPCCEKMPITHHDA